MCSDLDKTLYRVAEEVSASLAFMLPIPPEKMSKPSDESRSRTWTVSVGFTGHANGNVILTAREEVLPQLTANMLGLPEGDAATTPDQEQDALMELANVICGNLMTEIWGAEATCVVAPPCFLGQGQCVGPDSDYPPAATARLELIEGRLELALFVDEAPVGGPVAPVMTELTGRSGRE